MSLIGLEPIRTETRAPLWQVQAEPQEPAQTAYGPDLGTYTDTVCGSPFFESLWCEVEAFNRAILPAWPVRAKTFSRLRLDPSFSTEHVTTQPAEAGETQRIGAGRSIYSLLSEYSRNLTLLEKAAESGSEDVFVRVMHRIDWSLRPASDFVRAVNLALAAGAHLAARELASLGAEQFADRPELQKMARILAPPRVVQTNLLPAPSVQVNQAWLRTHAGEYKGRWVVLRDGELVAAAETAGELKAHLKSMDGIMVARVS